MWEEVLFSFYFSTIIIIIIIIIITITSINIISIRPFLVFTKDTRTHGHTDTRTHGISKVASVYFSIFFQPYFSFPDKFLTSCTFLATLPSPHLSSPPRPVCVCVCVCVCVTKKGVNQSNYCCYHYYFAVLL